jgi:Putative transposase of IS4/5 family (DUF4096)
MGDTRCGLKPLGEQYRREDLRYASDMTDAEWALIEPHMPEQKALGRPRIVRLRGVVDALLYVLRTACPWRLLPRDFPKRSTVQRYFYAWQTEGLWEKVVGKCHGNQGLFFIPVLSVFVGRSCRSLFGHYQIYNFGHLSRSKIILSIFGKTLTNSIYNAAPIVWKVSGDNLGRCAAPEFTDRCGWITVSLPLVERARLLEGNWKIRPAAGLYFKREWCAVVDAVPADLDMVRYWDLAATEKTARRRSRIISPV